MLSESPLWTVTPAYSGAVNANAWLSQVVSGAGGAGASCGSTTKSAMKPEGPSVAPGDWMSAKFGLRTDEDEEKDGQSGKDLHELTSAILTSFPSQGDRLAPGYPPVNRNIL